MWPENIQRILFNLVSKNMGHFLKLSVIIPGLWKCLLLLNKDISHLFSWLIIITVKQSQYYNTVYVLHFYKPYSVNVLLTINKLSLKVRIKARRQDKQWTVAYFIIISFRRYSKIVCFLLGRYRLLASFLSRYMDISLKITYSPKKETKALYSSDWNGFG